ncbi:GNAT family N-acetyltransferase [Alienimonas sp. DA493]|uniref:GNAT family N-acetyltransferase n=1 Tax=Alienimonas sp. DA493 TaxID=3373605 RepID=UPI003754D6EF
MPTDPIRLRPERLGDEPAIRELTRAAFAAAPHADGNEHLLVGRLRDAGALALSLVAEAEGELVGHAAFSPATGPPGSGDWYALGPISVRPDRQRQGIGGRLIRAGLEELTTRGAAGCTVLGDPKYYERFGFTAAPAAAPPGIPAEYFRIRLLTGETPAGPVRFHPVFGV